MRIVTHYSKHIFHVIFNVNPTGSKPLAAAADDEGDDVDVEGDDTSMTDEGGDDEDVVQSGASPDAATTLLFTKPVPVANSVGKLF